jgi:polar amino acid transport system permease protein
MSNDWFSYGLLFLKATGTTIWLSWLALVIAAVGGTLIALLRVSRFRVLRLAALLYIELFRSIPILIMLFFVYFGVPLMLGIHLEPFLAATLALAFHASASMAEVVRAGIESVGKGQWEAAYASGMRYTTIMRRIVGPQAIRVILPPAVGVYISTLKESSLASIIGYIELTKTGLLVRDSTGGGFTPLLAMAVIYFLINYMISLGGAALERRNDVANRASVNESVVKKNTVNRPAVNGAQA